MTIGYKEFEFDLPGALLDHLVRVLDSMPAGPLGMAGLDGVPEAQGVYQLFLDGELVYIGKTDAETGLLRRLSRHARKILHRVGLSSERVTFKAVRIFVFTAIDLETQLIRHYTGKAGTAWNGSGFGANDPGRERDKSKPGRFDREFPLDLDRPLDAELGGTRPAAETVNMLKAALPYILRVEPEAKGARQQHGDLVNTTVTISPGPSTARSVLAELTSQLPTGWQATALSALLILYKETENGYPGAVVIARS